MIQEIITHSCRRCGSKNIVRNGRNKYGNAQFHCHNCKFYGVLKPRVRYTQARKEEILSAYRERPSMRGISRIFGVSRPALATWIKKSPIAAALETNVEGGTSR